MENPDLSQFEDRLWQFETCWKQGTPPNLAEFCQPDNSVSQLEYLLELVKIDMEHRLRREIEFAAEFYCKDFPILKQDTHFWDLVGYELELRNRLHRLPDPTTLKNRFGRDFVRVEKLLQTLPKKVFESLETQKGMEASSVPSRPTISISELTPGDLIDSYRVERRLGSGAFSIVYLARDTRLGRQVALKFLKESSDTGNEIRLRTIREAQSVALLSHPNIVPVFGTGCFEGQDYIVSQFVDGPTMDQWLNEKSPEIRDATSIVWQLSLALAHAHQRGVIHRDIKPANVIIENDRPMLLDFGLARLNDANTLLTQVGDVLGTPAFMPPEQADGRAWQADPRSDVYSLGAVLYRLIGGKLPFAGSVMEVVQKVMREDPVSPRKLNSMVSKELETITLKCLEKEPRDRYQTAAELAEDLERLKQGRPIMARPIGFGGRLFKWSKRRPALATMVLTTLFAVAFLIGTGSQLIRVRGQRDRANLARARADEAESRMQRLLAVEAADAGRLSMQRGKLQDAISHFERSIQMEHPDTPELLWLTVESLFATRQFKKTDELLKQIESQSSGNSSLGKHDGRIYLWQANLSNSGMGTYGEPAELYAKADALGLRPADAAYVRAMLSRSSPEAMEHFQATIAVNPFHFQARRMLVTLLISLARFDEASKEAQTAMDLFVEDQDFALLKALALAGQGERREAIQLIRKIQLESELETRWIAFASYVDEISNRLVIHPGLPGFDRDNLDQVVTSFVKQHLPLLQQRGLRFPPRISPKMISLFDRLLQAHPGETRDIEDARALIDLLKQLVKVHPEGSLYSVYGEHLTALYNSEFEFHQQNNIPYDAGYSTLQEATEAFQLSTRLPTFVKSVRQTSRVGILGSTLALAHRYQRDVDENRQTFVDNVRQINPVDASLSVSSIRAVVITLIQVKEYELAESWADRWIEIAGDDSFDAEWHRIMVDRWRHRWLDVLRRCQPALEKFPNRKMLKDLYNTAQGKLQKALMDQ